MTDMVGSALIRRHIGRRFEAMRKRAGLSQEQAADELQRGRTTLARIEDGDSRVRFRDTDVKAMVELYDGSEEERDLLLALTAETRNGRKKSWWHDYTESSLPEWFGLYVSLEDSAETIHQYESELVPGLLQTRAYAEQVMRMPPGFIDEDESQRRVNVRLERQSLLARPRAPHLQVILNEAVVRREVGGPAAMVEQLEHLLDSSRQVGVSIRVVPFSAGVHGGLGACGPFSLLDFPAVDSTGEPIEPALAYAESLTGALYLQKPDEVDAYRLAWADLDRRALDEDESRTFIRTVREGFGRVQS